MATRQQAQTIAQQQAAAKAEVKARLARERASSKAQAEDIHVKATVVDEPQEPKAQSKVDEILARMRATAEELMAEMHMPSGKRTLISLVAGFITGGAVGYFGGTLLSYLVLGSVMLSGSALLAMIIYVLGLVLVAYAAYVASGYVMWYIESARVDTHIAYVKDKALGFKQWASGLLGGSSDEPVAA